MDVWEYFQQRDRELAEQSAAWENEAAAYTAEAGSHGQRGRMFGRVVLSESAYLQVHEVVQVAGSGITRLTFAYFLIYDGAEIWGYERDPLHDDMPVHRHDHDHRRYPAEPISFKDALTRAWETVAAEEELRDTTE